MTSELRLAFYPEIVYARIAELNRNLPNIQKWAIIQYQNGKNAALYDPETTYNIFDCINRYNLGQIYELRQVLPLFYRRIPYDPAILHTFAGDTSLYMAELMTEFCQEGFMYRYNHTNVPTCNCMEIEYREDECKPTCRECYNYVETPITDETTDEHFDLIPLPQRAHMNLSGFVWVLAFMLEGYQYEFVENTINQPQPNNQYFQFYARYVKPSKKTPLRDYQEMRRLMGEYFIEIAENPKPTPITPPTPKFPNFPRRQTPDEPNWWECM